MIDPYSLSKFELEAKQYEPLKKVIKQYIKARYVPAKVATRAVYGLRSEFRTIGYVTHGALTVWLNKWGFRVKPWHENLEGTWNHKVYIKQIKRKE